MSWIRPKTEDGNSAAPMTATDTNYNRDMPKASEPKPATAGAEIRNATHAKIGQSIHIEGTLTGNEDLTIDGRVLGKIKLKGHALVIGANGKIEADMSAKTVTIRGEVKGNITADDKIQVTSSGSVKGDLSAPRIALDDGANFAGRVDTTTAQSESKSPVAKPEHAAVKRHG